MQDLKDNQKINLENLPNEKLVRDLDNEKKNPPKQMIVGALVVIVLGVLTGFILSASFSKGGSSSFSATGGGKTTSGKVVGSADTKTFPDSAEGELQDGGLNGEGTHKLIRPGGDSQTVYLTSSVLDLNQFVGKKVRIWGQTYSAKKAGWLMDVGRVEVL